MMASSCRADSRPPLMVVSGRDRTYVMSGGGTLDKVLVSTTMSGWEIPIVAEERRRKCKLMTTLKSNNVWKLNGFIWCRSLHLEGLYSAYVSTCPSSSVSSSSASSSSSGGGWVLWTWKQNTFKVLFLLNKSHYWNLHLTHLVNKRTSCESQRQISS